MIASTNGNMHITMYNINNDQYNSCAWVRASRQEPSNIGDTAREGDKG
jgi:hypothetical protein